MGWTVHYKVILDGTLGEEEQLRLQQLVDEVNAKLHAGSERLWFEVLDKPKVEQVFGRTDKKTFQRIPGAYDPAKTYLWGFTKVAFSKRPEHDFVTVVSGLKRLAQLFPSWTIHVEDDFRFVDGEAKELGDPQRLLRR